MYWQDPEVVLPEEGEVVVCQVLGRNGLIKAYVRRGDWWDMNGMPIEVVKWMEVPSENGSEQR